MFCKWYCTEYIENNKWLYESNCGEKRIVSRWEKFFKHINRDDGLNLCPKCAKPITVGELM